MKFVRLACAALFAFACGNAYAFHSGGVAECEGCHSMHNSLEGAANVTGLTQFTGAKFLLKARDQSGACLNCHNAPDSAPSSYHISTDQSKLGPGIAPIEMTPGGDFAWLKKTYSFFVRSSPSIAHGERNGHNIVAQDYGYVADSTQTVAPGGNYPASELSCISCHDPHGRYRRDAAGNVGTPNGLGSGKGTATGTVALPIFNSGSYNNSAAPTAGVSAVGVYRILGGQGYLPKSTPAGVAAFANQAPAAVAPSTYNRSEATTQTVVAYGYGMSEWCANCHAGIHVQPNYVSAALGGTGPFRHPSGNNHKLTAEIVGNYTTYTTSGRLGGSAASSYSTLAPFELGTVDYTVLKAQGAIQGTTGTTMPVASTSANVMCLSCHRAHATGFESMTRFFRQNEFMTAADASNNAQYDSSVTEGKINFGKSALEQQTAYYGRPASAFGPWARNYCNKCHAKD